MSRALPEWIGKTDDSAIPARVKVRIFDKYNGQCAACTLHIRGKLTPEYDHIIAIVNGGGNRESNLQLLCSPCHSLKTCIDVGEKATMYRKRTKAIGLKKRSGFKGWRRMNGEIIYASDRK